MAVKFPLWEKGFFPRSFFNFLTRKYFNYSMTRIGSKEPIWLDVSDAWKMYCEIPHLNLVINKKAEMLSNAKVSIVNSDNEVVERPNEEAFLRHPNPLQFFKEWISQLSIFEDLFGNGFVYPLVGSQLQTIPSAMWNLPSSNMKINPTGKIFEQSTIEGIIENYQLVVDDKVVKTYQPDELIHTNNNDSKDYITGTSKLEPLRKNLTNIDAVLKTANVLYNERGAIFMFSQDSKGEMGAIPLNKEEKKRVEEQMRQDYGVHEGQSRNLLTSASLKATPISFPIKDLMMFEELESDFSAILGMYGMDRDLFPSTKGATFENKKEAKLSTYQDTIIPEANKKADMLTNILRLDEQGLRVKLSYDHLAVFQEDELNKANVEKVKADKLINLYNSNLVNINEVRQELELPELNLELLLGAATTGEGESLETPEAEDQNAIAQANLRGSVGGVQGILQIQQSFNDGITSEGSAISILIEIYGFSEETARQILGI